jgi:hypothetical protein
MNEPHKNHPAAEHLAALNKSFEHFVATAHAYPRHLVQVKPNERAFSATEIVYHMHDVERLWQRRIRGLLDRTMTHFLQMDPDKEARDGRYNEKPHHAGLEELSNAREETHELIQSLSARDLELAGMHSRYGEMNVYKILETMEGHDRQHAAQLTRTLKELGHH